MDRRFDLDESQRVVDQLPPHVRLAMQLELLKIESSIRNFHCSVARKMAEVSPIVRRAQGDNLVLSKLGDEVRLVKGAEGITVQFFRDGFALESYRPTNGEEALDVARMLLG